MAKGIVEYKILGLDRLNQKLTRIKRDLRPELEEATKEATAHVLSTIPAYPPAPIGSEYRRTGSLGRSYTDDVKQIGHDIVGSIGTRTVYAPWVVSEDELPDGRGPQAKVHQDRWYTLQKVVKDARGEVVNIYRRAVRRILRRRA